MEQNQLFQYSLNRVYFFLNMINLGIDLHDINKSFFERLQKRLIYCMHFIQLNANLLGEVYWLIDCTINSSGTLEEYTNLLPGLTLGLLGDLKTYFMIKYAHHIIDLIQTFEKLFKNKTVPSEIEKQINKKFKILKATNLFFGVTFGVGLLTFAVGPLVNMMSVYLSTGEIKYQLPFIVYYPFDAYSLPMWPIIYVAQMWSAIVAANFVYGPDCFYYTAVTFIQIQFMYLQYDVDKLIERYPNGPKNRRNQARHTEFVEIVNRHRELIRCVGLLETIYSKSTLFNVVSSSLIICVTGFNIMVIKDVPLAVAFSFFLAVGFIQICLFCNCGEQIIQSSCKVGEAIYNSNWYDCSVPDMKDYLLILTRAQKPCKLTAYGFSVISLNSFAKILSTSWSYFALLLTLYSGPQHPRI